ncbi:MAG: hypothetical protein CMH88_14630 [Oceanibulbus sp.]|jgi:hypothetical protein|uniref:hypothetical protein n=1 Tax=Sulfitobacter dubius TaxID=218673 RepID=UPI000C3E994C|nr:hypothetical protein [Sulfitobacter sp.]
MSEFLLGVVQTAIGSGIGFGLGILAFHYQQKRQADLQSKADWRRALGALNRLSTAAGANIEALANSKLQLIDAMRPEVEQMKTASNDIFDIRPEDRAKKLPDLMALSESLLHFYMSLPQTSIMPPPNSIEYSSLSTDMPALSLFVHRATGMMQELNERIVSRNSLIAEHARELGAGAGMTGERLLYYSSMLAGEGEAISVHVDDAIDLWRLVADQVTEYMKHKAKGEPYIEYQLVPKAIEALPKEELFPAMRAQLVTFADCDKA